MLDTRANSQKELNTEGVIPATVIVLKLVLRQFYSVVSKTGAQKSRIIVPDHNNPKTGSKRILFRCVRK